MQKFSSYLYEKLIRPFTESNAPISRICWGAAIGMFMGMTPTVGAQMYCVSMVWVVSRFFFRVRFNLPIALAMTWISNPVTFIPMYYLYLKTGSWILVWFGQAQDVVTYHGFVAVLNNLQNPQEVVAWQERLVNSIVQLFWEFGWPFVLGSLLYAVPLSLLTYPVTGFALTRHRRALAQSEGISYEEWKHRHVQSG